jgi:hypothetical protein
MLDKKTPDTCFDPCLQADRITKIVSTVECTIFTLCAIMPESMVSDEMLSSDPPPNHGMTEFAHPRRVVPCFSTLSVIPSAPLEINPERGLAALEKTSDCRRENAVPQQAQSYSVKVNQTDKRE